MGRVLYVHAQAGAAAAEEYNGYDSEEQQETASR
jgi:hypothetical protein